jgi:DNA-binding NarL/FixJ family response regulator
VIRVSVVDDHPVFRQGLAHAVEAADDFELVAAVASVEDLVATAVSGLGDGAIIDTVNTGTRRITVKEGKNALEVTVTFYTQPIDDAFVTHLATVAVGHL